MVNPKRPVSQDWPNKETSKRLTKESDKTIEDSSPEESFHDSKSDRRIKLACVRCRKRKTKCSGTIPCWTCSSGGYKCEFYKKPKKVAVFDVELQEYKDRIQRLEKELESARERLDKDAGKSIPISNIERNPVPSKAASESSNSDRLNLSIWLGSASSELICWNLQQFKLSAMDKSRTTEEIIISPNFSSFHEETTYDYLLHMDYGAGNSDELDENRTLTSLTYDKVLENLDNVVLFVNAGYLTIEPEDFKEQCKEYFDLDSSEKLFKPKYSNFKDEKRTYFLLKLLTLLALGDIYGRNSTTGERKYDKHTCAICQCDHSFNKKCPSIPGIQYFEMMIKFIPSSLVLLNITGFELEQTFEIIELFGLVALYLRILDKKNAAVAFTVNALQLCISLNLHKERHLRSSIVNQMSSARIDKVWWGTFCLNRFFSSRISQPLLLSLDEIRRVDLNDVKEAPNDYAPSKYDYSRLSSLRFYIELAKISDEVIRELYSLKVPFDNKVYLQSILNIVEKLVNWMNNLPVHLKLKLPMVIKENGEINRLICSLHLNYLHHIYLATIPVLLNIVKVKVVYYYRYKKLILSPLVLSDLPKNVSHIIHMLLNSCQLTINIFTTLYKQKYLRVFGITDLDFLFCSSLVFLISAILQIDTAEFYSFGDYLAVTMNIMKQMWLGGNMIAKGKLSQLLNLLKDLEELSKELGNTKLLDILKSFEALRDPNKSCTGSKGPNFYEPEVKDVDDSLVSKELNPNSQPLPTSIIPGQGHTQQNHEKLSTQYSTDTTLNQNVRGLSEPPMQESPFFDLTYPAVGIQNEVSKFMPSDYTFITNEEFDDYSYDALFPTSLHAADEDIEFMNLVLAGFFSDQF